MRRKAFAIALGLLFSLAILAGCTKATTPSPEPTTTVTPQPTPIPPSPTPTVWHLLILGDSSLGYLADTYPQLIERDTEQKVVVEDYLLSNLAVSEVVEYFIAGKLVRPDLKGLSQAISEAEIVVMFIGNPDNELTPGNEYNADGCLFNLGASVNCNPASLEGYTNDLKYIWGEIFRLRNGQPTILRTMDLYTPLVNEYKQQGLLAACTRCLENYSNAIRLAAEAYHIPFVSRYDIFNGVNHDEDPNIKGYIFSDGVHPSLLGAQLVAEQFAQLGYEPVPPP